jgi:hypothetical protein
MNNLIKTPQQLMLEQAGIPHLAGGGSTLTSGARQLLEKAISRFRVASGRAPTAEELSQLEQHAASFSRPTTPEPNMQRIRATTPGQNVFVDSSGQAYRAAPAPGGRLATPEQALGYSVDPFGSTPANFRARKDFYDPSIRAYEERDPFLTQAMTGRAPNRTRQKPLTTSYEDLHARQLANEEAGVFENVLHVEPGMMHKPDLPSPTSTFLGSTSTAMENAKIPTDIKEQFYGKFGRYPSEDEYNDIVSSLNVLRHNYTGKGKGIFGERPVASGARPTREEKAAMDAWREQAQASGIAPNAVKASPSELKEKHAGLYGEMDLGPETGFKTGGHINPDYMRAEMTIYGHEPQKFASGGVPRGSEFAIPTYAVPFIESAPDLLSTAAGFFPKTVSKVIGPAATRFAAGPLGALMMAVEHGELNPNEQEELDRLAGVKRSAPYTGAPSSATMEPREPVPHSVTNKMYYPKTSLEAYKMLQERD